MNLTNKELNEIVGACEMQIETVYEYMRDEPEAMEDVKHLESGAEKLAEELCLRKKLERKFRDANN